MKMLREVRVTPKVRKHQRKIENLKPAFVKCIAQILAFGLNLA